MPESSLRRAIPDDIEWLIIQLHAFDAFTVTKTPLFPSYKYAVETLYRLMLDPMCCFVVACQDQKPVGFVVGYVAPHLFNPDRLVLTEWFWWVQPEHRRSRAGLLLLEAFIEFGRLHASSAIMTLEAKSPVNDKTLTKRGFVEFERNFILEY